MTPDHLPGVHGLLIVRRTIMAAAVLLLVAWSFTMPQSISENCYPIDATDLREPNAPAFGRFKVGSRPEGRRAPVDLNSHPLARRYRTVLRAGARKGPNFAGHYTVVGWGCGSSCIQFAVVDARNGAVFFPQDFDSISTVHVDSDGFQSEANGDGYWGLRYRLDSRLLIVLGALDESEEREGATYYVFENGTFERIHTRYLKKRRCDGVVGRPSNTRLRPPAAVRDVR